MDRPGTLIELITRALETPRERALEERLPGRSWETTSSQRLRERIAAVGAALMEAGIAPGDRVGILSENCVDWLVCAYAIVLTGAVSVPVYANCPADHLRFIVRDAEIRLMFTQTQAHAQQLRETCGPDVRSVILEDNGVDSLRAFEARGVTLGGPAGVPHGAMFGEPVRTIGSADLAILMYTSGTTGDPKGVMLTHGNIASNVVDALGPLRQELRPGDVALSVLPFAHIYEHTNAIAFLYLGLTHVVSHPDRLLDDIRIARPRIVAFVPRIFERVLTGVVSRAKAEGGLRALLVPWALATGREAERARAGGRAPSPVLALRYGLARALVLGKLKAALGLDCISHVVSGSAPLQRDTALTFAGIGIPVCEGYGLTETSPVVAVNRLGAIRYGTVGRPIANVEVRIAGDGEVLVRGPNVMRGYYHHAGVDPFTSDGWFKTGDIGQLDADGFLTIIDRKNELFKVASGKWVSPARVEGVIRRSPLVGQALVLGAGRAYPAVLVAPVWEALRQQCDLPDDWTNEQIAAHPHARACIAAEVAAMTAALGPHERIRCVALLPRDLTVEAGELSPTLKVKRRVVEARYADLIDDAYAASPAHRDSV